LRAPGPLPPADVARARKVRDGQAALLAQLHITTNVPAQIEIDNLEVGRAPLAGPIAIAAGGRLLSVVAPGYEPVRKRIEVPAGTTFREAVQLLSIAGRLGQLRVSSPLPGAEVWLDGKLVGRTPLSSALSVTPGKHAVCLQRAGYQQVVREVEVTDGASQDLDLPAEPAPVAGATARLRLVISEPGANVEIDGRRQRLSEAGVTVPLGLHRISVERAGYFPHQRVVMLDRPEHEVHVTLEPTEETRYEHGQRASSQRLRAYLTLGAGALLAGGGALWLRSANHEHQLAQSEFSQVELTTRPPTGQCSPGIEIKLDACMRSIEHANERLDSARSRRWLAGGTLALGAAVAATGVVLRLLAEDPARYELTGVEVLASVGRDFGLVLRGRF
jgi:hypothetical protein